MFQCGCKINVGEPDYPLVAVARGKREIVGENKSFQVADHDFSKLSIVPDGTLIQTIPENEKVPLDNQSDGLESSESCNQGQWYREFLKEVQLFVERWNWDYCRKVWIVICQNVFI